MKRYFWIRTKLFVRQARWGFVLISAWFLLGLLIFRHVGGLSFRDAFLNAVYLEKSSGTLWELYSFWGQCVLFGIVISIFLLQALQRYDPEEGCRMLAAELRNHVLVVGYTHLGARIVRHLRDAHLPYVLVDQDSMVVDDLVRLGEPVIVDNAKQESTLVDAGVAYARTVIVATNNVETALLVTKKARDRNPKAHIIVRCYIDDFAEILENLGANEVISSSKSAFEDIAPRLAAK
ncbi:MAG TPA: NAD(P)-binding protein [Candidatus Eisenbacteria bacterium]|nr:NAD(P)-binding protein [Candidatus Eisenbacteria bacterium]